MSSQRTNELFGALEDLLDEEREALLTGDLDLVGRMLEKKETLIEELSRIEEFEVAALSGLQNKMRRNQDLLDSALEGIRAVAGRLAEMRRVRTTLDTYDSKGSRKSIEIAKDGTVEKRA